MGSLGAFQLMDVLWTGRSRMPGCLLSHVSGPGGDGWRAGLSSASLLLWVISGLSTWCLQKSCQTSYTAAQGSESKCSKREEVDITKLLRQAEAQRHSTFPVL